METILNTAVSPDPLTSIYREHHGWLRAWLRRRLPCSDLAADLNESLGTQFSDEECHTVGGLILNHLGRVPKRNEAIEIEGMRFQVLRADNRRLYTLSVSRVAGADDLA